MDVVFPAIYQAFAADGALVGLTQEIGLRNNPDEPKSLTGPLVVIHPFGGPDAEDLHGAAVDIQMEIKVWGYGNTMVKDCIRAARRVDEILLTALSLPAGNFIGRFRPITGWQDTDTADPKLIHLQNQYSARYWAAGKITALLV